MSNAIGSEIIATVVGYNLTAGNFNNVTPNLPQRIAILGEANTGNQVALSTDPKQVTSAVEVGEEYGFGSPLYQMMRVIRSKFGDVVGGIPTVIYPQDEAVGSTSKILRVTISGVATANGTHSLEIAGRQSIDGESFKIPILKGDTEEQISQKIADSVNNVTGSIVTASVVDGVLTYFVDLESKWKGLTANDIKVRVITGSNDLGLDYVVSTEQAAAGTPAITPSLLLFGDEWNTLVVNPYGEPVFDDLEDHNGFPDPVTPTGRYQGRVFKPYISLFGSVLSDKDDIAAITDPRKNELTNALCPAPNSFGMPYEAAANMVAVWARIAQDKPHLDATLNAYPDMPGLGSNKDIGDMVDHLNRDFLVKKGASTVTYNNGYVVEDFITTYNKVGESIPSYRYVSNLNIDFNYKFKYALKEAIYVVGHVIAGDNDIVEADKVTKPKKWKKHVGNIAEDMSLAGMITDVPFTKDSITVEKDNTNPDRLNTNFSYKRRSMARVSATTVEAGFSFN